MGKKGVHKEDYVHAYLQRMERQNGFGAYFILKSMEVAPSFRSTAPRFPVGDPDYRIIDRQRSRYTHYYFDIRDEVLGLPVRGFFPPFPDYRLPQRPSLHRARTAPPQDHLQEGRQCLPRRC